MPAPVNPSASSLRSSDQTINHKPRFQTTVKKRINRRRGRNDDLLGSEDEIEREIRTDSESEGDLSSLDSDSYDSDTEPASEDVVPGGHFTPGTSQSPGDRSVLNKDAVAHLTAEASFFQPSEEWSDMVADETVHGPADLPVIEFADFDGKVSPSAARSHSPNKPSVKATQPSPDSNVLAPTEDPPSEEHIAASDSVKASSRRSSVVRRPFGQSARQAYQQRLETDPSYVPTVGGFWGHDDRLLDKDLRSLSGWWRGRWQGRGRGRGFVRGRGRGYAGHVSSHTDQEIDEPTATQEENVPPTERAWTHDGFEEMKQKEEQRRQTSRGTQSPRGIGGFRGKGLTSVRRGRGVNLDRVSSPTRSSTRSLSSNPRRIWYTMKPELMWTKQHEGFLYFDPGTRTGKGPVGQRSTLRVKLPGREVLMIKGMSTYDTSSFEFTPGTLSTDVDEKMYPVRLPKPSRDVTAGISKDTSVDKALAIGPVSSKQNFVAATPPEPTIVRDPSNTSRDVSRDAPSAGPPPEPARDALESQPKATLPTSRPSDIARDAQSESIALNTLFSEVTTDVPRVEPEEAGQRPQLPVVQTVFTPPIPQPSPVYGSPYTYTPTLPPGIAINQHGVTYELATGRPVYLQAPPAMYNPRPIIPSHVTPPGMQFVSGHMHAHSAVSPDFLAQPTPATPPLNGFIDPSTGSPIFSFPRQSSRIEIRDPKSPGKPVAQSSTLRTAASTFEPSRSSDSFFPSIAAPAYTPTNGVHGDADGHGNRQHMPDPAMVAYSHYPNPYYYPEAFNYVPYVDVSQHLGQYEMYTSDSAPQGTVYY